MQLAFRVESSNWQPGSELRPKNPRAERTLAEHVAHGSRPGYESQYISFTASKEWAMFYLAKTIHTNRAVSSAQLPWLLILDLRSVPDVCRVYDFNLDSMRQQHLKSMNSNFAMNAREIVVDCAQRSLPPDCVLKAWRPQYLACDALLEKLLLVGKGRAINNEVRFESFNSWLAAFALGQLADGSTLTAEDRLALDHWMEPGGAVTQGSHLRVQSVPLVAARWRHGEETEASTPTRTRQASLERYEDSAQRRSSVRYETPPRVPRRRAVRTLTMTLDTEVFVKEGRTDVFHLRNDCPFVRRSELMQRRSYAQVQGTKRPCKCCAKGLATEAHYRARA